MTGQERDCSPLHVTEYAQALNGGNNRNAVNPDLARIFGKYAPRIHPVVAEVAATTINPESRYSRQAAKTIIKAQNAGVDPGEIARYAYTAHVEADQAGQRLIALNGPTEAPLRRLQEQASTAIRRMQAINEQLRSPAFTSLTHEGGVPIDRVVTNALA